MKDSAIIEMKNIFKVLQEAFDILCGYDNFNLDKSRPCLLAIDDPLNMERISDFAKNCGQSKICIIQAYNTKHEVKFLQVEVDSENQCL